MERRDTIEAQARAAPLVTMSAFGLGPLGRSGLEGARARFEALRSSSDGYWMAVDTAGVIGRRLLSVVAAFGGSLTLDQLRFQTGAAEQSRIDTEVQRLATTDLIEIDADGSVHVADGLADHMCPTLRSMADQNAMMSDAILQVCRTLQLNAPSRKHERIAAIAEHFADDEGRQLVLKELGHDLRDLLKRIVETAGTSTISSEEIGLSGYQLRGASARRHTSMQPHRDLAVEPLAALVAHGIVGVSEWEGTLWIWQEALPLLDFPLYQDWSAAPQPAQATCSTSPLRFPPIVSIVDRALRHWAQSPPKALKNQEARLPKTVVRSTAKALSTDESTIDLAACLVIDIGLLLTNTVATTGRGRKRTVDQVWLADPALVTAWNEMTQVDRWTRLIAAWCLPERSDQQQLLFNRHLILWELTDLHTDRGFVDDDAFAPWIGDRYATLGLSAAAKEVVSDLRALGMVRSEGPLALTAAARALLDDPASLHDVLAGDETSVVVQGDLTVLVPPGLDPEIYAKLTDLATVESDGGAQLLRLDEDRITKAVQAGSSAEDIVEFLTEVSSVPLVDTVTRLVEDAAAGADRVKLVSATTVVVADDPADLQLACSIKSAKLIAVSDTVAVSPLATDKVRAALDRKGLAPAVRADGSGPLTARTAADEVADLRARAEQSRQFADTHGLAGLGRQAERLELMADELSDPASRLKTRMPLAITPAMVASLADEN